LYKKGTLLKLSSNWAIQGRAGGIPPVPDGYWIVVSINKHQLQDTLRLVHPATGTDRVWTSTTVATAFVVVGDILLAQTEVVDGD
jgi:hypothetical protein